MKKIIGGFRIAEFVDYEGNYVDITVYLRLSNAPKEFYHGEAEAYCITEEQAQKLKDWIKIGKDIFK